MGLGVKDDNQQTTWTVLCTHRGTETMIPPSVELAVKNLRRAIDSNLDKYTYEERLALEHADYWVGIFLGIDSTNSIIHA